MMYLISAILLTAGCTINVQIETEYASQNGDGEITEQAQAESKSTLTPTTNITANGL